MNRIELMIKYLWFYLSKNWFHIILQCREQRKIRCLERDSNLHLRVSTETTVLPIELSSQRRLVASLIQFKCTKYFGFRGRTVFELCFRTMKKYYCLSLNEFVVSGGLRQSGGLEFQKPEDAISNLARGSEFFLFSVASG